MAAPDTTSVPSPLPLGLTDPAAYIQLPRFDLSATFHPSYAPSEQHTVSYAIAGSSDPNASVVVWMNGMGSHRLSCIFPAGPASEAQLRVLVFDRPGAGKSTACPLKHRFQTSYEALRAVMAKERIAEFGLISHSNVSTTRARSTSHELTINSTRRDCSTRSSFCRGSLSLVSR